MTSFQPEMANYSGRQYDFLEMDEEDWFVAFDRHANSYIFHRDWLEFQSEWTTEWPTEPGLYWFYGWCFGEIIKFSTKNKPPELHYVSVRLTGMPPKQSPMYVTNGHFLYKQEGAEGKWLKVELPELPNLEEENSES